MNTAQTTVLNEEFGFSGSSSCAYADDLGIMSRVKWMGDGEGHFRRFRVNESASQYENLPLSPPALVSAQITEASSVRRSTLSVAPRPGTFVCTGQHLTSTERDIDIQILI